MNKSLADALFSKVRQSVIGLLFCNPSAGYHLREIARLTNLSAPTVRFELESLLAAGIVADSRRGNMRVFSANLDCPLFEELRGIAIKTFGIADRIKAALSVIAGIKIAFVFGSIATKTDTATSDIDVLIVGDCSYNEVIHSLHEVGQLLQREINPQLYSADELAQKYAENNHFVTQLFESKKIFLIGDSDGFEACKSAQHVSTSAFANAWGTTDSP